MLSDPDRGKGSEGRFRRSVPRGRLVVGRNRNGPVDYPALSRSATRLKLRRVSLALGWIVKDLGRGRGGGRSQGAMGRTSESRRPPRSMVAEVWS